MSSADRSRTADSLTDFEFHPSSFGHSLQFDPTCDLLQCTSLCLEEPLCIRKFCHILNNSSAKGVLCQQLPKQLQPQHFQRKH